MGDVGSAGDLDDVGDSGCVGHCVGELAALSDDFLTATATSSGGGIDTVSGGGDGVDGATRPTSRLVLSVEYTDGVSAMSSDNDINFVSTGSSASSSCSVTVDEVGAPESRFLSDPCVRGVTLGLRKSGCCSFGGAEVGGGMTMGDDLGLGLEVVEAVEVLRALRVVEAVQAVQLVRAVEDVSVDGVRVMRRGFRGGGRGIGGSACLVCSYRSATRLLSSRKGVRRVVPAGLPGLRTLANFWSPIVAGWLVCRYSVLTLQLFPASLAGRTVQTRPSSRGPLVLPKRKFACSGLLSTNQDTKD